MVNQFWVKGSIWGRGLSGPRTTSCNSCFSILSFYATLQTVIGDISWHHRQTKKKIENKPLSSSGEISSTRLKGERTKVLLIQEAFHNAMCG